jgi:hypothetical protein
MTLFWLWVIAGCATCGLLGFSAVQFGARRLEREARAEFPSPAVREFSLPLQPQAPRTVASSPLLRDRAPILAAPRRRKSVARPQSAPEPTGPPPEAAKLVLWARQVKAGERKMSIATDGCRVTWNRTCKHGHPSWLVHLGYLKLHHLQRHTPR